MGRGAENGQGWIEQNDRGWNDGVAMQRESTVPQTVCAGWNAFCGAHGGGHVLETNQASGATLVCYQ